MVVVLFQPQCVNNFNVYAVVNCGQVGKLVWLWTLNVFVNFWNAKIYDKMYSIDNWWVMKNNCNISSFLWSFGVLYSQSVKLFCGFFETWWQSTRQSRMSSRYCCQSSWSALQWHHNGHNGISNHKPHGCLLNRLFGRRSKKTSKLQVTGLCVGNSLVTGEFPAQMASSAENGSIWWHHDIIEQDSIDIIQG